MNKRKGYECKYNDHQKNAFDLLKNSPNYTFKGKYGDRSREFVCGYRGKKYGSYSVANNRRSRLTTSQLFKRWIALSMGQISFQWTNIGETNCTINWIEIYMVDSTMHLLKNLGLNKKNSANNTTE